VKKEETEESLIQVTAVLRGLLVSLALLMLGSLILGIITNFIKVSTQLPTNVLFILNYIAIFIGGIVTAYSVRSNGWLNGGLVGLIYMLILIMMGNLWGSVIVSLGLVLRVIIAFLVSSLGGMVGVNIV
jgi:putative membrane protein (TIGR04086 family)